MYRSEVSLLINSPVDFDFPAFFVRITLDGSDVQTEKSAWENKGWFFFSENLSDSIFQALVRRTVIEFWSDLIDVVIFELFHYAPILSEKCFLACTETFEYFAKIIGTNQYWRTPQQMVFCVIPNPYNY